MSSNKWWNTGSKFFCLLEFYVKLLLSQWSQTSGWGTTRSPWSSHNLARLDTVEYLRIIRFFFMFFFLNIIYLNLSNEFFASIFIFVFYCHSLDITHLSRFWAILISHMDITVYLYAYYCIYAYIVVRDFCTNVHQYSIIVTFVCKQKQPMETFRLVKDLLPGSGMSRLTTRLSNWNTATPARSSDLLELLTAASATTVSVRNELRFWSDLLTQILQYEQ